MTLEKAYEQEEILRRTSIKAAEEAARNLGDGAKARGVVRNVHPNDSCSFRLSMGSAGHRKLPICDLRRSRQKGIQSNPFNSALHLKGLRFQLRIQNIRCWKLPTEKHMKEEAKLQTNPIALIPGGAAIRQAVVLNDKRHIITKDTDNNVAVYDVLKAQKVEDLGQVDFQQEIKNRFKVVYVPNWFNVDLKTGMLTIHLGQDEVDCFSAWVSARDAGIKDAPEPEQKVNYGKLLLQALLEHWRGVDTDPENKLYFSVPPHTPLIFSEVGGRTLYRVVVDDASGDTETSLLNETVPSWVTSNVEENCTGKFIKIQFYLQPHSSVPSHLLKQDRLKKPDRLVANDFIQCRKVAEHILDKLLGEGNAGSPGGTGDIDSATPANGMTADQIELLCNDQVLDPSMDLRTVKYFIWKMSSDLTLYYKLNNVK
ncbi:hypothetical protein FQR65_LT19310 [Abscondita terminalis]|nr:hypothetical protein FQR65_LT19310 [Abscondita terminalis]